MTVTQSTVQGLLHSDVIMEVRVIEALDQLHHVLRKINCCGSTPTITEWNTVLNCDSNPFPIGKQTDPQLLIQFILHTSKLVVIHKLIVKTLHVDYGATVK